MYPCPDHRPVAATVFLILVVFVVVLVLVVFVVLVVDLIFVVFVVLVVDLVFVVFVVLVVDLIFVLAVVFVVHIFLLVPAASTLVTGIVRLVRRAAAGGRVQHDETVEIPPPRFVGARIIRHDSDLDVTAPRRTRRHLPAPPIASPLGALHYIGVVLDVGRQRATHR